MKTPQTFKMYGSMPLLEAMRSELHKLGYEGGEKLWNNGHRIYLGTNCSPELCKEDPLKIKSLYLGDLRTDEEDIEFNLPEQYNEALAFAKEQIEIANKPALKPGDVGTFDVWKEGGHNWTENKKGDIYQITGVGCAHNLNRGRYELSYCKSYSGLVYHCTTLDEAKEVSFRILYGEDITFLDDKVIIPEGNEWHTEKLESMISLLKLKAK